jgi:hypothetical protein
VSRRRRVVGAQLELFAEPEHQAAHWSTRPPEREGQVHEVRGVRWVGVSGTWMLEETVKRLAAARAELVQNE